MSEYGLGGVRDSDGERNHIEHTYEWGDDDVTIKFLPPTIAEVDEIETLMEKEELSPDEIQEPLDDYLVEPSIADDESWTLREFNCYIEGIYQWSMGQDGIGEDIADELDEREDGEGN